MCPEMATQTTNPIEIAPGSWLVKGPLGNAVITRISKLECPTREAYRATANDLWCVDRSTLTEAVEWAITELEA